MQNYESFKKAGTFTLASGAQVTGELQLNGAATELDLYSSDFFDTHSSPDIFGVFFDRSKVSLLQCLTSGLGTGTRGEDHYHFSTVFPHFVIFGDRHIGSAERTIKTLSFTVDDAATVFYDFSVFGSVFDARSQVEEIIAKKHGTEVVEVGDDAQVFYFTGKHQIFTAETAIGKISATHGISYPFPGPKGIHVENTIRVNIEFDTPRVFDDAVVAVLDLLRFVEVVAGRPQNLSLFSFSVANTNEDMSNVFDVYWCLPPQRDGGDDERGPHPADVPIQAAKEPNHFASVLKCWLQRNESWRSARLRFQAAFAHQNNYTVERIVGTANMFDIVPEGSYPSATAISAELAQARDNARLEFRSLVPTAERDSVLNALGRIGQPSLKTKVRSRAMLIKSAAVDLFPELDLVVDQAIDCRNFFVHGSTAVIDYGRHFDQVRFFTDTLEFIFAASDLLESGWDPTDWLKRGSTLSHPFGLYLVNYQTRLRELKAVLAQAKPDLER